MNVSIVKLNDSNDYAIYMVQQGVYSTMESMEENTVDLSDYMYVKKDDKYYVYLGVTQDIATANIIKDNYDMDLYIKENNIEDEELLVKLKENDNLINENTNKNDILSFSKKSLEIYEGQMNVVNEH